MFGSWFTVDRTTNNQYAYYNQDNGQKWVFPFRVMPGGASALYNIWNTTLGICWVTAACLASTAAAGQDHICGRRGCHRHRHLIHR